MVRQRSNRCAASNGTEDDVHDECCCELDGNVDPMTCVASLPRHIELFAVYVVVIGAGVVVMLLLRFK